MTISITPRVKKRDIPEAIKALSKAIASLLPSFIFADPTTAIKGSGSSISNLIDMAIALNKDKSDNLEYDAWDLARASFAAGISIFLEEVKFSEKIKSKDYENISKLILERADILFSLGENDLSLDSFVQPLLVPAMRDASKCVALDLQIYNPIKSASLLRKDFEDALFRGMRAVRSNKPDLFRSIETALSGKYEESIEKRNAHAFHQAYIVRWFTQVPIFGQESTGLTVSDIYVRQRCLWIINDYEESNDASCLEEVDSDDFETLPSRTKQNIKKRLIVSDIHISIETWLERKEKDDAIRVIAGGPGSGKSTFARSLALDAIDAGKYDILYVPLQDLPSSGSFEQRVEILYNNRSELGFDRVDSPLRWLGRTRPDGTAPLKPILLICDGLDEIAPPDTREAASITTDFIQILDNWVKARNSHGCYTKCVVLGRDSAAEEAFKKLGLESEKLIYIGGLRPLNYRDDWRKYNISNDLLDEQSLSELDQRVEYWKKWAYFFKLNPAEIPEALEEAANAETALQELTAEPLLLYLLLWTGYLGPKWREAADNRNVVYREIFNRIYRRDWGQSVQIAPLTNRTKGGHVTTTDLNIDEFMALQEALGLAAWPTGGRVVTKSIFDKCLHLYLTEDAYADFLSNNKMSFKSVALHSYTRSSDAAEAGYEFVHKSLGEFLIGRSLASINIRAIDELGSKIIDARCKRSAALVASIGSLGVLTAEIARFYKDEMRLLLNKDSRNDISMKKSIHLTNWVVNNHLPIDEMATIDQNLGYHEKYRLEIRALDVYWFFFQTLSKITYPKVRFSLDSHEGSWASGPTAISWPSPTAFIELFIKLSMPYHINETGRISTFDRLDLSHQMLTDKSFGAVGYELDHNGVPEPKQWLNLSAVGCRFKKAYFFGSSLHSADFSLSSFEDCTFDGTRLDDSIFSSAHLRECTFNNSNMARSSFNGSKMEFVSFRGVKLFDSNFDGAQLNNCRFNRGRYLNSGNYSDFSTTVFKSSFKHTIFGMTSFVGITFLECSFYEAQFTSCHIAPDKIVDSDFNHAEFVEVKANAKFLKFLDLHEGKSDGVSLDERSDMNDD